MLFQKNLCELYRKIRTPRNFSPSPKILSNLFLRIFFSIFLYPPLYKSSKENRRPHNGAYFKQLDMIVVILNFGTKSHFEIERTIFWDVCIFLGMLKLLPKLFSFPIFKKSWSLLKWIISKKTSQVIITRVLCVHFKTHSYLYPLHSFSFKNWKLRSKEALLKDFGELWGGKFEKIWIKKWLCARVWVGRQTRVIFAYFATDFPLSLFPISEFCCSFRFKDVVFLYFVWCDPVSIWVLLWLYVWVCVCVCVWCVCECVSVGVKERVKHLTLA